METTKTLHHMAVWDMTGAGANLGSEATVDHWV